MDYLTILLLIAAVHLAGAASPGPTVIVVTGYSMSSRGLGMLAVCGALLASLLWAILAALGLGAFISRFPALYTILQVAGAAYLVWLGVKMLLAAARGTAAQVPDAKSMPISAWHATRTGFLTNMTNPKSIVYYTSVFAAMIPPDAPGWLFVAAIGVALSVSAACWSLLALLLSVSRVQEAYGRARRAIDAAMGVVLICLGMRLVFSR